MACSLPLFPRYNLRLAHAVLVSLLVGAGFIWFSFVFGGMASPAKLADGEGGQSARCRRASSPQRDRCETNRPHIGVSRFFHCGSEPLFWRSLWVRRVLNVVMPPLRPFNASTNGRGGKGHRSELFMAFRSMPSRSATVIFYTLRTPLGLARAPRRARLPIRGRECRT
jgi:hypothetical protein